jgi:hypothetical protein
MWFLSAYRTQLPNGETNMPEYKGWHQWLCGKKSWSIHPCLYQSPQGNGCPLDAIGGWHTVHDENSSGLANWSQVKKGDPEIGECVVFVKSVLGKLEVYFDEFFGQVRDRFPNVSREEVRACWTAHLVADYGCRYWYEARGKTEKRYRDMPIEDQWATVYFVKDVGNRFLPVQA